MTILAMKLDGNFNFINEKLEISMQSYSWAFQNFNPLPML